MVLRNEGNEMDTALHITLTDGEHRVDSRLVAQALGIEHESLVKTITIYRSEIEELGSLRFQIGVKPPLTLSTTPPRKVLPSHRG